VIELRYGSGKVSFVLPANWQAEEVAFRPHLPLIDPLTAIKTALRQPIGSPGLGQCVRPGERVCILVNDSTRKARTELFMPVLLDELNRAGVPDRDIFAMVATGSHRLATPDDMEALVGAAVAGRIAMYSHDCHDQDSLTNLGTTTRGTPVFANTRVLKADRRVLTGSVVHHWFAGFGGGKKALVPGICGYDTIRANHSLLLDPASRIAVLDGNPAAEDQLEAARMIGGDFLINTILDTNGDILGVFAGDMVLAHRQACDLAHRVYAGYKVAPADVVLASCGGWPKDINVYQAQKSLENGALACRRGGVVVLAAECREGIGSDKYWEWARKYKSVNEIERALREHFDLGGHKAFAMARLTAEHRVVLLSSLPAEVVHILGFEAASTAEEALAKAIALLPNDQGAVRAVVMPFASLTVPIA
jgi:nickel-dependent lactate racemase